GKHELIFPIYLIVKILSEFCSTPPVALIDYRNIAIIIYIRKIWMIFQTYFMPKQIPRPGTWWNFTNTQNLWHQTGKRKPGNFLIIESGHIRKRHIQASRI